MPMAFVQIFLGWVWFGIFMLTACVYILDEDLNGPERFSRVLASLGLSSWILWAILTIRRGG